MYLLICLLSWFTLGWIASRMAERRGRNVAIWFILGFILGIIALIILYFLPPKNVLAIASPSPSNISPIASDESEDTSSNSLKKLWYYLDQENKQYGPMNFDALQNAWDTDLIGEKTYVWNEDMENWERLEALPHILSEL